MIATAKTPINPPTVSSSTSSFLLSDLGPLGSAQRHGCSSVNQTRRTERVPPDSYSAPLNDIIKIPIPLFACRQQPHTCSLPPGKDKMGWRGRGMCYYQTSCFHLANCKKVFVQLYSTKCGAFSFFFLFLMIYNIIKGNTFILSLRIGGQRWVKTVEKTPFPWLEGSLLEFLEWKTVFWLNK